MIETEIWYYVKSQTRIVRLTRKASLSAAPFIGSEIDVKHDHLTISRVIFNDGGGIVAIAGDDHGQTDRAWDDAELPALLKEMEDIGWEVSSNVPR